MAAALRCWVTLPILVPLQQNLAKKLTVAYDKSSCDSSTGGWREKDMLTCRQRSGGFRELCSGCVLYDPSCSCQGKYQTMAWGATTKGVTSESRYIMNTLSFPSSFFFSYPIKSKTVPTPCCSLRPAAGPVAGVNWDNCMVLGWATAMPVQLFVSWGNRVAHTFHRDFAGSRVLGMYNGFCLSKELPSCWIRCVVFCQQPLL